MTGAEPTVEVHPSKQSLSDAAAVRFLAAVREAQRTRGMAQVALTGGSMGSAIFASVLQTPGRSDVDWSRVHVWWGDERYLPAGDPDRNDTQNDEAGLSQLGLDGGKVYRVAGPGRQRERRGQRRRRTRTTIRGVRPGASSTWSSSASVRTVTSPRCSRTTRPSASPTPSRSPCTTRPSRRRTGCSLTFECFERTPRGVVPRGRSPTRRTRWPRRWRRTPTGGTSRRPVRAVSDATLWLVDAARRLGTRLRQLDASATAYAHRSARGTTKGPGGSPGPFVVRPPSGTAAQVTG